MLFGKPEQLGWQIVGVLLVAAYSGIVTTLIMYLLKITMGIRVTVYEEPEGLDKSQHGDVAYFEYVPSPKAIKKMATGGSRVVDANNDDDEQEENNSHNDRENNRHVKVET